MKINFISEFFDKFLSKLHDNDNDFYIVDYQHTKRVNHNYCKNRNRLQEVLQM